MTMGEIKKWCSIFMSLYDWGSKSGKQLSSGPENGCEKLSSLVFLFYFFVQVYTVICDYEFCNNLAEKMWQGGVS